MRTHGESKWTGDTVEYRIWAGMKTRCLNPKHPWFHRYGGRGIKICQRWLDSYENFLADMGRRPSPRHTLERKDNDGPYSPENVIWATRKTNSRNRSNTHWLTFQGVTLSVTTWAERTGISRVVLFRRLYKDWSVERTLTQPVREISKRKEKRANA